jgi:hypothetical protein
MTYARRRVPSTQYSRFRLYPGSALESVVTHVCERETYRRKIRSLSGSIAEVGGAPHRSGFDPRL